MTRQAPVNHRGFYERKQLERVSDMALDEITIPKQASKSKYEYPAEQRESARELLDADPPKSVGDGPFPSEGAARQAASVLRNALQREDEKLSARVFELPEKGSGDWHFGLRVKPPKKSDTPAAEPTEGEPVNKNTAPKAKKS